MSSRACTSKSQKDKNQNMIQIKKMNYINSKSRVLEKKRKKDKIIVETGNHGNHLPKNNRTKLFQESPELISKGTWANN